MKHTFTTKILVTSAILASLLMTTPSPASAFKGMGSTGGGAGMSSPHGGDAETIDPNIMGHQGNTNMIVANVNGREITMGDLMQSIMTLMTRGGYGGREMSSEMSKKLRYDALQELAMEELAYQKGVSLGITADPVAVQKHLDAKIAAEGGTEAFEKTLAERQKTLDDVKNEISRFLVVREAIKQDVYQKVEVDQKEVDKIYSSNKAQFSAPEQVVVTDVVFFLDPADPGSAKRVEEVAAKITSEHNNNPSQLTPDGFVVENGLNVSPQDRPGLYHAAKKMKPGTLSAPLVIDGTLHLIKLDHYQPAVEMPEDQAKATISGQLKSNKRREMLAEWRNNLLKDADIKITHELLQDGGK